MSNNIIQIKRSTATAAPATLNAGELAYSNVSQVLYIGDPGTSAVTPIAGVRNPGVLTANQALVANSTSGINQINAGIVNTSTITVGNTTVNSYTNSTAILLSDPLNNTTINTSSIFVTGSGGGYAWVGQGYFTATSGSQSTNLQYNGIQVGANVGVGLAAVSIGNSTTNSNLTYNSLVIGNSTVNVSINSTSFSGFLNASLGSNTYTNVALYAYSSSNNTITVFSNTGTAVSAQTYTGTAIAGYATAPGIGTAILGQTVGTGRAGSFNATTSGYGAFVQSNTGYALYATSNGTVNPVAAIQTTATGPILSLYNNANLVSNFDNNGYLHIGNSTVNVSINSTSVTGITTFGFGNTTVNSVINSISGDWFSTTSNTSINASSIWIGNNTLGTATANTLYFNANSSSLSIGNTSDNIIINANTVGGMSYLTIGNNSVYSYTNSTAIVLNDPFNTATITTSSILVNSATLNTLVSEGYVTVAGPGSQFANLTYSGLQVGANVGVGEAGVSVGNSTTNSNLTYNSLVVGNATNYSTVNTTTVNTGTIITTTGATLGGTTTTVSSNLNVTGANFSAVNITVSGNLSVTGTVTTINSQQLIVNDNIIELADGNLTTDIVDTGVFSAAGNSTNSWYSGYVRQAAKSTKLAPYFWFFGSNTSPNTASTIDTSSNSWTGYIQSYLVPYGTGGAFVANATVVNITANSTVSSALVANSLTLTTALGAASGGTGILGSAYAAGDMIYAATSSPASLSRLSVPGTVANGQVLQIINNLPAYGVLDGGTF